MTQVSLPRGVRNNNPLNIVRGSKWKGLRPVQSDPRFCQFISRAYGWRAALILLRNYILGTNSAKKKFDTIEKIILRWAPLSENASYRYIDAVCMATGIHMYEKIEWSDRIRICDIVKAMAYVECATHFELDEIYSAYDLLSGNQ